MQVQDVAKDEKLDSSSISLKWHSGCSLQQFAELEAWAEPAFPAGNNNPTVVLLSWNINKDVIS